MARACGWIPMLAALTLGAPGFAADAPPGTLPGCTAAPNQNSLDPLGTVRFWHCASGVTARFWLHPDGWPDAEAAFAEAFTRMPEIDGYWRVGEAQGPWPLEAEDTDLVVRHAHEAKYRSLRGGQKTWVVRAGARPRVLVEATWEVRTLAARIEAARVLNALIAHLRSAP